MSDNLFFKVRVISPRGLFRELECESLRFQIPDGVKGNGGGSMGIRRGHTDCLIALDHGRVFTYGGDDPIDITVDGGFAMVEHGVVTIFAEKIDSQVSKQ